ncbi:OmpA family protein [Caminibacter pacificus]|uniref:OOP family OmpA-OmpF porin n=1 Tax=Caminibacter pacificus TaxID=1424653 RepID=A0AAJ4RDD1_9BACT|nr:OmpA family protein [Caminibacter pacificus]NPA87218.1 OmpA family protein [Campylobacterota bacterium]QCI28691.1 OmpA family protein [Caminibacter pacificus]ROR40578.1 OOP family OmpA-OmpF porin [Caminibacter pacificus]
MKKMLFLASGALLFLVGCAEKPMANNVVELAGNQTIVGWKDYNNTTQKQVTEEQCKPEVKYIVPKDSDGDGVPDIKDKCPNTPKNLTVDHNGCPVLARLYINFDFNKAYVKKIYYPEIKKVAEILKANPKLKIEVAGYTDNIGSAEYNQKLSYKRALAVRNLLVLKYGIDANRIVVKGYGEKYPLVPNTTATNRALNRRVEIVAISGLK